MFADTELARRFSVDILPPCEKFCKEEIIMNQKDRRRYEKMKPAYDALMKYYPFTTESLDGEEWKPIPNYEDYHGSNFGRVKSFCKGKVKILKPAFTNGGYLHVQLHKADGKPKRFYVHRIVAQLFIPNPLNKPEVNHKDGVKFNCHASNLEWATSGENMRHAVETGLQIAIQGIEDDNAKIKSESDVIYIRENPDNLTSRELAEMFGVDQSTIGKIQRGERYKNCGGTVRKSKRRRVPADIRAEIKARYQKGVSGCGILALAKQFGYDNKTIRKIVKEEGGD